MIKMINDLFLARVYNALEYAGFVQLVIQVGIFVHRKGRVPNISVKEAYSMTLQQMVLSTLHQCRDLAKKRGEVLEVQSGEKGKSQV